MKKLLIISTVLMGFITSPVFAEKCTVVLSINNSLKEKCFEKWSVQNGSNIAFDAQGEAIVGVFFDTGESNLDSADKSTITTAKSFISTNNLTGKNIYILGMASNVGNENANKQLSVARRNAVVSELRINDTNVFVDAFFHNEVGNSNNADKYRAVYIIMQKPNSSDSKTVVGQGSGSGGSGGILTGEALINSLNTSIVNALGVSVWRDADGEFNTSRLLSDSIAGVVLGTAGGLITSSVVKKNQIEEGYENIHCTVGGQNVANWGDEFVIGMTIAR